MALEKVDFESDIKKDADLNEAIGLMEPTFINTSSGKRDALGDLSLELAAKSAGFRKSLNPQIAASLADLVRSMNCY